MAEERFIDDEPTSEFRAITPARCEELLQSQSVGRIAWQAADDPQILPVTYARALRERSSSGPRRTACCLSWSGRPTSHWRSMSADQDSRRGWSVVVQGRAQGVAEPDQLVRMWTVGGVCSVGRRSEECLHPGHSAPRDRSGGGCTVRLSLDMRKSRARPALCDDDHCRNRLRDGTLVPIYSGTAQTPTGLITTSAQSR